MSTQMVVSVRPLYVYTHPRTGAQRPVGMEVLACGHEGRIRFMDTPANRARQCRRCGRPEPRRR